jgi:hypothetical protein
MTSIENALKAFLNLKEEQKNLHIVLNLKKIPAKKSLKPLVVLTELKFQYNNCFVVKDKDEKLVKLLVELGVPVSNIFEIGSLKKKFKVFEEKRIFSSQNHRLIVDSRIYHLLPNVFGKTLFKKIKSFVPFEKTENKEKLSLYLNEIDRSICFNVGLGNCVDIAFGSIDAGFNPAHLKNVISGIKHALCQKLGNDSINGIHLKLSNSFSIPIIF